MPLGASAQDIQSLLDWLPFEVPEWLAVVVTVVVLIGIVTPGVMGIAKAIRLARGLPLFRRGRGAEQRRVAHRKQFADWLESRLRALNDKEDWTDHRYAQLEAEVEAEVSARGPLGWITNRRKTRRERSLTDALAKSSDQLILLQGDPGSGKSVAMRHLGLSMAKKAAKSRRVNTVLPLYLNLKKLERNGQEVNADLIESFVLSTLRGVNRDIDRFVEAEFRRGVTEGTWFFLFDSFDEIPDVLSATERDETVQQYSEAIYNFLHGMRSCRGIVASRYFRAPQEDGWPKFHVMPLSESRKADLIRRSGLEGEKQRLLIGELPAAEGDLPQLARNPMFLGLLCEFVRSEGHVPSNPHAVFDDYIDRRFADDAERLTATFAIDPAAVRTAAEQLAFVMTARRGMGLNPSRAQLLDGFHALGMSAATSLETAMDALEYVKLAKSESDSRLPAQRDFTFAHRRFQEYFATCTVLEEPGRVPPRDLLNDWSWRETAVTLLQTQTTGSTPLLEAVRAMLTEAADASPDVPPEVFEAVEAGERPTGGLDLHEWPPHALHLLGVLQAGFAKRADELPDDLRELARQILVPPFTAGQVSDQKWSLEVVGTVPEATMIGMLSGAYRSPSAWLKEVAYWQVGRLRDVPPDLARAIRRAILRMGGQRVLGREWLAVRAQLLRLDRPRDLLRALNLVRLAPLVDIVFHLVAVAVVVAGELEARVELLTTVLTASIVGFYGLMATGLQLPRKRRGVRVPFWLFACGVVRLYAPVLFVALGLAEGSLAVAVLLPYALLWAPAAALAVVSGRYLHPGWLPFLPGVLLIELARWLGSNPLVKLGVGALAAVAMAAIAGLIYLVGNALPEWLVLGIFVTIMVGAYGFLGYRLFRSSHALLADWRWHRRRRRAGTQTLTALDLLEHLARLQTEWGAIRLISEIRASRLLDATPGDVAVIEDLLRAGAAVQQKGTAEAEDDAGEPEDADGAGRPAFGWPAWRTEAFAAWFSADVEARQKRLREFGPSFVDELGKLHEGLRNRVLAPGVAPHAAEPVHEHA